MNIDAKNEEDIREAVKYDEFVINSNVPVKINYQISVNKNCLRTEIAGIKKSVWPVVGN